MVYHELRSPLALVATAARSAAEECSDDYVRARCESIVRATERMLRTAARIMDIASASEATEQAPFSPREAVEEVIEDYRRLGAAIILEVDQARESAFGIRAHLEALVCSLVGNAVDHGDPSFPILVSVACQGGVCRVSVRNAVRGQSEHRGLGLGSYIVEQFSRSLGASVTTSMSGSGYSAMVELACGGAE
jgi:signal transduction histidine kinase